MGWKLDPTPDAPDKLAYWFIAAVAGALAGGFVFNILRRVDPL